MKLIATKNQTYKTRHLVAGEPFEASDRVGHLLIAIRKAKAAEASSAPSETTAKIEWRGEASVSAAAYEAAEDEINQLRKTARRLGIMVDRRWSGQTLRDKIAQAQG